MSRWLFDAMPELAGRVMAAEHVLVCLDFDGTLAPIADRPDAVTLPTGARRAVEALAGQKQFTVAIISGRSRADMQERLRVADVYYAGNHGLEISGPGALFVEPTSAGCREAVHNLAVVLNQKLQELRGVRVEDKGLTLTIHYRQAPTAAEEVRRVVHSALATADHPFLLTVAHMAYEIRPRAHWNKGSAVGWIRDHLGRSNALVIYAGDDSTDEDAFTALPDGITVRVGEAPETSAKYFVKTPEEIRQMLVWLIDPSRGIP